MANQTIATTFRVVDEMSPAFQKMNKALQALDGAVNSLEGDLNGIDSKEITALKDSVKQTESAFSGLAKEAGSVGNISTKFKTVANAAGQASHSIKDVSSGVSVSASTLKQINGSSFKQVGNAAQTASGAVNGLKNQAAQVDNELDELERDATGLSDKFSGLKTAVVGAVTAFASLKTAQAAISLSDEMTQTTSRLNLMNDGLQSTEELQQQIKKAALASHAEYSTLADTVAKLGNNAGSAFSNSAEIVAFAEQLSKQFALSGASADEMAAATLQLTQGLGSGVLRGDEFNSVMEQAPGIAQMMADYLEVDKSKIRDLAAEGALTADVVKNAVLGASDETNRKFDQMKVTFGQLWTDFKTNAMFAFTPISDALSNMANNPKFQEAINNIGNSLVTLGQAAGGVISTIGNGFVNGFSWIINNARFIISGITGITAAIGGLTAAAAIKKAGGISEAIAKIGTSVANSGLAQSLLALINPATLAVAAIVGLGAATAALMASGTSLTDISKGFSDFDDKIQDFVNNFGSMIPSLVEGIKSKLPELASQAGSIMATLATGILNSGVNLIGAGVQIVVKLAAGLAQAMPTIVSSGITFLTNLLNGILAGLPQVAGTILQVLTDIVGTISENLPSMIQAGVDTIQAFASGLGQNLPTIITQAFVAISGFIQTVAEHLPELITKGMELIGNLVAGIIQNLPTLIASAVTLIGNFAQSIIQNLPQIIQAGVNLVGSLVMGLIQSIPALLVGTAQLLGTIMQSLADLGPQALNKMLEIGGNIVEGLKQGFLNAWNGIGDFFNEKFNGLVGGIKSLLGIASPSTEFAGMGTNMVAGLQQGFDEKMPVAIDTINKAMAELQTITQTQTNALVSSVTDQYNNLAVTLQNQVTNMAASLNNQWQLLANTCISILTSFAQTMVSAMTTLVSQVTSSWNLMNTTVNSIMVKMSTQLIATVASMVSSVKLSISQLPPHFRSVATDMMNGLINGINSKKGTVVSATSDLVAQIKAKFIEGLGIHSPALFGVYVGEMLAQGVINGLNGSQLTSFVESIIESMKTSFEAGRFNPNQLVDYLDEDTPKLIAKLAGIDTSSMNPEQIAYPLIGTMGTQTSWFGPRESPGGIGSTNHGGVDLAAPTGTPIAAALGGTVTTAGWYGGYGNAVVIDSGNGIDITYGHMSQVLAQVGQNVAKGSQIGLVGSTGNSTGPHLHFEMHQNGSRIDPQPYIEGAGISAGNTLMSVIQNAYNLKKGLASIMSLGNVNYDISAGAAQWTPQVLQALAMLGQPASLLQGVLYAIQSESGGNPNAINDWDSNAAMGDPSRGLLQTIGSTFNAYRNPSLSPNIYDPLSNIYAGLNYMIQRYGSVAAVVNPRLGGWYGYATGTENARKGWALVGEKGPELVNFGGGEVVKNNSDTNSILNDMANTGGYDYPGLIRSAAQNEVAMTGGSAGPVNISVNNEIHNEGDLAGAESRITQTIAQTIRRERKVTGGIPHAY